MIGKVFGALVVVSAIAAPVRAQGRFPADAINLSQVHVYNSPTDVANWPVTTAITQLNMRNSSDPSPGLSLTFSALQTWPDYWPPGWDGPLQYTVWAVWYAAGQWNASGIIQMWRGRGNTGAPILTDFAKNWIYDSRWGPGWGHQPVVGEQMGFFVTAGDARGRNSVTSVRERSNVVMVALPANDTGNFSFPGWIYNSTMDVDGDGRSEIAVYRPSTGQWLGLFSSTNFTGWASMTWGVPGDIPVPGDYDGDGLTDLAVYRPSTGTWLISKSSTRFSSWTSFGWGTSTDIPVPGDYDGDGKTDPAVFRPSTGYWLILKSGSNYQSVGYLWGVAGDKPVPGDYDGDGKTDMAVYRPSTGYWFITKSSASYSWVAYLWGAAGDTPMPGDYDGDGKTDIAVYRPSNGYWLVLNSGSNNQSVAYQWGVSGDVPVTGDYDGDGKTDIAVYRPSSGFWLVLKSSTNFGGWMYALWGVTGDVPLFQPK